MTIRSVLFGLLLAIVLGAITFFNDTVLRNTYMVGNFLPVSVFGLLIVVLLVVNPLLRTISHTIAFTGKELAVIAILGLFSCFIPGGGLMYRFTHVMMWPYRHAVTNTSWHSGGAAIRVADVRDRQGLVRRVVQADGPHAPHLLESLIEAFPADEKAALRADESSGNITAETLGTLLAGLESLMSRHDLFPHDEVAKLRGPRWFTRLAEQDVESLTEEEIRLRNRGVMDLLFAGLVEVRRAGALESVPPQMLTDLSDAPDNALTDYTEGVDRLTSNGPIVSWGPWIRPLKFWIPLILSIVIAVTGLSLVLHRQWSSHEHLPYPIVEFARALIPGNDGTQVPILRNKVFLIGMFAVLAVNLLNYANLWWPDYTIPVKTRFDLTPLVEIFPIFQHGAYGSIFNARIFFTAVAFAFFLASDVSLSLGIAPYVYSLLLGVLAAYGMSLPVRHIQPTVDASLYAGAYAGVFLVLVYTGRHYYRKVFMNSIGLGRDTDVENHAVWGGRIFLIFSFLFILQLVHIGLDWHIALFYTMTGVIIYVVVSRLLAEAGIFFIRTWFAPCAVVWGFMGATALGPDQHLIMAVVTMMILFDPREAFMPFAMTGICLADRMKLKISRTTTWGLAALLLALAVALPATLYVQYRHGSSNVGGWWFTHFPVELPYNTNITLRETLDAQDALQESYSLTTLERLQATTPIRPFLTGFGIMLVVVLVFAFMRYRFAWWPFHPLIFLVLGTWPSIALGPSFLLGWMIKAAVTRYGGARLYRNAKPFMIGVIAGDMLAALVILVVGAIYYAHTGRVPMRFLVTPT